MSLTPAEHRGLRELYAATEQLARHWSRLGSRLQAVEGAQLTAGAHEAQELLDELVGLTAARGLYGRPGAVGLGGVVAGLRNGLVDLTLERNQALRLALLDVEHVTTLLDYLAGVARGRRDTELAAFHERWSTRLGALKRAAREAAVTVGADPAGAVQPAAQGRAGRAGHALAVALGTFGEWLDRQRGQARSERTR